MTFTSSKVKGDELGLATAWENGEFCVVVGPVNDSLL